jgi:hypothetical protein
MAKFLQRRLNQDGVLAVDKEASDFGFSGQCHDVAKLVTDGMGWAIWRWSCRWRFGWVTGVRAEVVMAADATSSLGHGGI